MRLAVLVLLLPLVACDQGNGRVNGASLTVPGCREGGEATVFEPFHLTLNSFNVTVHDNLASLRFASKAGRMHEIDQIGIDLWDVGALREANKAGPVTLELHLGTTDLQPAAYTDGATMAFALNGKCPMSTAALGTTGTLTFEQFSSKDAERVVGSFAVDIIDRRSGEVLGADITGDFDFEVETATPATPFQPENF